MLIPHSTGKPMSTKRQKILECPENSPPSFATDRKRAKYPLCFQDI